MPCIPSSEEQREMQAENGLRAWRNTLELLLPTYRRFLPVFEALLAEHQELARQHDAQQCLTSMRELAATEARNEPAGDLAAMEAEAARLKRLSEVAESVLCTAGTHAWNAERGRSVESRSKELTAFLERHQQHREADRRARLSQLQGEVRQLKEGHQRSVAGFAKTTLALELREERFGEDVEAERRSLALAKATEPDSFATALLNLEGRIAAVQALSVDEICSDRFVF